jgi:hypothetical protein
MHHKYSTLLYQYLVLDVELLCVVDLNVGENVQSDEGILDVRGLVPGLHKSDAFTEAGAHLHAWTKIM